MYNMSREEWWEFASYGTRTGKLATVRVNGTAHVAPIWFLLNEQDGYDEIIFNTGSSSLKGKALQRDPRFSLCVDDDTPPFSYVVIQAEATIVRDLDESLEWAIKIAARYMGADKADAYGKRNAVPDELLIRARITKVIAHGNVAD
ncbi:PPOX class F420-dependent oxidoreductase [Kibdelosporangium philippinense]|uniref:PPOX class F420-dependent oxidoreductase n=1 Tax=Kibdelosporangium philippinense TaxID=211113 RepID=A0ABS8ZRM5_9PSEU|nr:PPOX class F420-dependent oxidoreductase [Kibdelosporangium philippinense]MCE7009108.1 PPOX class F420-dependent oxidoreductase [Kibdelosporangium philippinense]